MSSATPPPAGDPRFIYREIRPPSISIEQLNSWMASLMDSEATKMGVWAMLFLGLKIALVLGYLLAWHFLVKAQLEYDKQKYERERSQDSRTDLAKDPLSGERKDP